MKTNNSNEIIDFFVHSLLCFKTSAVTMKYLYRDQKILNRLAEYIQNQRLIQAPNVEPLSNSLSNL